MSQYYSSTSDLARIYGELARNMQKPPEQMAAYQMRQVFEQPQAEATQQPVVDPVAQQEQVPPQTEQEQPPTFTARMKPPVRILEKQQAQDIMTPAVSPVAVPLQEAVTRMKASISDPMAALRQSANDIARVNKSMVAAQKAVGDANQAEAEEKAKIITRRNTEIENQYAKEANAEAMRKNALDQSEGKIRQLMDDVRSFKIDPDRLMNTGNNRVVSAIAMALGEIGGAFAGRGNAAMQIIENKIDRDIAAQRDELANKRDSVDSEMNLLGMMRQRFGDEKQAESAARLAMREFMTMEIEANAAKSDSDRAKSNAALLAGQIETSNAKDRASIAETEVNIQQRRKEFDAQQAQNAAMLGIKIQENKAEAEKSKEAKGITPDAQKSISEKLASLDSLADLEKKFKELKSGKSNEWFSGSNKLTAFFATNLGLSPDTSPAVAYDQYRDYVLQPFIKGEAGTGTIQESEREMFAPLVPDSVTSEASGLNGFKAAREAAIRKISAEIDVAESNGQNVSAIRELLKKKVEAIKASNSRGDASKKEDNQGGW